MSRLRGATISDQSHMHHDSTNRRHSDTDTMVQHPHSPNRTELPPEPIPPPEEEVPQLFCQLDILRRSEDADYAYWKEKARWVRFEEIAENVLGRWSKPHVATLMQSALLDLKSLLENGVILLDIPANDLATVSQAIVQSLDDSKYIENSSYAQKLVCILGLPHFHHYEKRSVTKTASSVSLSKQGLHPSPSFIINNNLGLNRRDDESVTSAGRLLEKPSGSPDLARADREETISMTPSSSKNWLKVDRNFFKSSNKISTERDDYNQKLQRKMQDKSEGASILICPVDFVTEQIVVFVRLQKAVELSGMLEIKLSTRFLVVLIGPEESEKQLLQIGRTMATILTDDICREYAYSAKDSDEILKMMNRFMQDTYVIPPSEWDPTIRIEPPQNYMSKEERQAQAAEEIIGEDEEIDLTPHTDPNLVASKRPFHGLYMDIRNKLPFYLSDFTDCASLQCLAATLYLYLVCLCSVVAFGGMLGTATENYMATMECILAASIAGILFALFGGQPLNVLSATGPMLILERILEHMCKDYHINFLEFRLWIGIWIFLLLLIFVTFNLSFLVKYITRFTEDCFASLVALIFIYDAIREILKIRKLYPVNYRPSTLLDYSCSCLFTDILYNETSINDTNVVDYLFNGTNLNKTSQLACTRAGGFVIGSGCSTPVYHADIFFCSVLLFVFTFFICMALQEFRHSTFFPSKVRTFLGDFSVLIAIVIMSVWDTYLHLNTPKLQVPTEFIPTRPHDRGWIIPFFGKNPLWTIPVAILPALIATILIFMDQQITAVIINRKEFKLKKKLGYHLDLFILSITILIQSVLGLPWFVAATVLALTHVNALKIMSDNSAPGEKPKFEGILEQRVSALLMAILTGLSVFFTHILGYIPMPVLYGVFMFMGVTALRNMQIFDRILLFFMPQKHQPDHPYLRHVRITRVHLFTIIQVIALVGMFAIKSIKSIAIGFPLLVLATCFVRKLMDKIFTQEELYWLDDILPGKNAGRVRRVSIMRNVHIQKDSENNNTRKRSLSSDNLQISSNGYNHDIIDNKLSNITEVLKRQDHNSIPIGNSDQSSNPLIVITDMSPSSNTTEEAEHLMHRELSFDKYHDVHFKLGRTHV
ncbi:unnamed protein product [Adineta steineri]|uniref:Anion exchange protein n=1 Tax=Adineta steineri TaxID=433720 RepID=A0A813UCM0_9BILA|nr:unnamed protein product [Adineta steineri]